MIYLLLSVVCSVTVGVIFKLSRQYNSSAIQMVATNYAVAIFLCFFFFDFKYTSLSTASWTLYLSIGFLLPIVFLFLATSIKQVGIVKTDAAQRLSLFIPILAAWLVFDETFNGYKLVALIIGFPAILMILMKPIAKEKTNWTYPLLVLLGFGIIDILFKKMALYTTMLFTSSLVVVFSIALVIMVFVVCYDAVVKATKITLKNILLGGLVGVFNFGNILFYLKAHQVFTANPSTVFAGMNLGVIILGSIIGVVLFKEKLSVKNYLGLLIALIAILLIVFSQQS